VAKTLIEDPANRKLVSVASCWEIAIKSGLGKLRLGEPTATYIPAALSRTGFNLLQISVAHATAVETLPPHHRDPFDRMLVAQGIIEGLPIVSADVAIDPYGVRRLW
jgi:PIN domain nuclease of toxin-antitoxin system